MKNNAWIAVGIIIVLGVLGYFVFNKAEDASVSLPGKTSIQAITLTPLEKGVFIKSAPAASEVEIIESATTSPGQVVKTSASGRALLEWPLNHPTIVDYSSEISIVETEEDGDTNSLSLISGEVWSRTKNTAEKGEGFEIKTGNAVAVVRGTAFSLSYKDDVTTLLVTEGSVSLYKKDKETGEAIPETKVVVTAGKKGIVKEENNPIIESFSEEDKKELKKEDPTYVPPTDDAGTPPTPETKPTTKPAQDPVTDTKPAVDPTKPPTTTPPASSSNYTPTQTQAPKSTVSITSISPKSIAAGDNNTFMTLTGSNFLNVADLVIQERVPPDFSVLGDTSIQFRIGRLPAGTHDLYFVLKDESTIKMPGLLIITK